MFVTLDRWYIQSNKIGIGVVGRFFLLFGQKYVFFSLIWAYYSGPIKMLSTLINIQVCPDIRWTRTHSSWISQAQVTVDFTEKVVQCFSVFFRRKNSHQHFAAAMMPKQLFRANFGSNRRIPDRHDDPKIIFMLFRPFLKKNRQKSQFFADFNVSWAICAWYLKNLCTANV